MNTALQQRVSAAKNSSEMLTIMLILLNVALFVYFLLSPEEAPFSGEPERLNKQINPDSITIIEPEQGCIRYETLTAHQAQTLAEQLHNQIPQLDVQRPESDPEAQYAPIELRGSLAVLEVISRSVAQQNIHPQGSCEASAAAPAP